MAKVKPAAPVASSEPRAIGVAMARAHAKAELELQFAQRRAETVRPPFSWFTVRQRMQCPRHFQLEIERAANDELARINRRMDRFFARILARIRARKWVRAALYMSVAAGAVGAAAALIYK
jgi:hypothetical protein